MPHVAATYAYAYTGKKSFHINFKFRIIESLDYVKTKLKTILTLINVFLTIFFCVSACN